MSDLVAKYVFPDVAKAFELMDEEELQMSRPIKFRAWDIDHYIEDCIVVDEKTIMVFDEGNGFYEMVSVGCVEQYTGLKDKNGKEIYEGDIVRCYSRRKLLGEYQVIWNEDCGGFECESLKPLVDGGDGRLKDVRVFNEISIQFRVIGNIHESNMEELCPKE